MGEKKMFASLKTILLWDFFSGLPAMYQAGYLVLLFVLVLYTILCINIKYNVNFEVRSSFDNKIIEKQVTIILDHAKKRRHFDTSTGKYSDKYLPGEYTLSVQPHHAYEIYEPTKITVNKYSEGSSEPKLIFLNVLEPFSDQDDEFTEDIKPSGSRVAQTAPDEITLYTIIESLQNSGYRPLEKLTIGNFKVFENYPGTGTEGKEAKIVSLKPLQTASLNVILVLDVSGSMDNHIDQVKIAVREFIKEIKNKSLSKGKISVLRVTGDSVGNGNFLRVPPSRQSKWYSFDDDNSDKLVNSINNLNTEGNTPLYDAINLAGEELFDLDRTSYNVIICLSDGEDNRSKITKDSILEKVRKLQVPVFSIGFSESSRVSEKLNQLIEIAKSSGAGDRGIGSFINTDISQLKSLFKKIAGSIGKAYKLIWKASGAEVGEVVNVTIKVSYKGKMETFETKIKKTYTLKPLPLQPVQ